jgi:fibronectin-binding autotransporter adhesin
MSIGKLFIGASLATAFFAVLGTDSAHAAVQTCNWTGSAGDNKFSTAGNWSNCGSGVPQTGDMLAFSAWTGVPGWTEQLGNNSTMTHPPTMSLVNDLPGTTLGGVSSTVTSSTSGSRFKIDSLTMADQSSITGLPGSSSSVEFEVGSVISTGNVTIDNMGVQDLNAAASTIKNGGYILKSATTDHLLIASGAGFTAVATSNDNYSFSGAKNVTLEKGADVTICAPSYVVLNISNDITFGGGTGSTLPTFNISPCMGAVGAPVFPTASTTFTGKITLLSDATVTSTNKMLVMNNTLVSNGHQLTINAGDSTIIKGNGTVGSIVLQSGSAIAPGMSPGCLTTGDITWNKGASYDFDLGGTEKCTGYDQIHVNGVVNLGDGTLATHLYGGYTPKAGDTFTIIENDGADAVSGTFDGIAEGSNFTQNGIVFKITYKGGDGNDVTLTVQNVPAAPNTGVQILRSNPILIGGITIVGAALLLGFARAFAKSRR